MLPSDITCGKHVWWDDPDGGLCSGPGVVVGWQRPSDNPIIKLLKDDGGEVECFAKELRLLNPVTRKPLS
jgi:hypothetical protein